MIARTVQLLSLEIARQKLLARTALTKLEHSFATFVSSRLSGYFASPTSSWRPCSLSQQQHSVNFDIGISHSAVLLPQDSSLEEGTCREFSVKKYHAFSDASKTAMSQLGALFGHRCVGLSNSAKARMHKAKLQGCCELFSYREPMQHVPLLPITEDV